MVEGDPKFLALGVCVHEGELTVLGNPNFLALGICAHEGAHEGESEGAEIYVNEKERHRYNLNHLLCIADDG